MSANTLDLRAGGIVEFEVVSGLPPHTFALITADSFLVGGAGANKLWGWYARQSGVLPPHPSLQNYFWPQSTSSGVVHASVEGDRFAIVVDADGKVSYHINYNGASSHPFYVSPITLDTSQPHRVFFHVDNTVGAGSAINPLYQYRGTKTRFLRNNPEFDYTGAMQKADNSNVLPAVVHARVRMKSAFPYGKPSDWVYGSFTR